MKKPKIGFLTPIFPPDYCGMANLVYYKDLWLREKGYNTKIITFSPRDYDSVPETLLGKHILRYKPYFRAPKKTKAHLLKDIAALMALILREFRDVQILEIHGYSIMNYCLHAAHKIWKRKGIIQVYKGSDGWLYNEGVKIDFRKLMNRYAYTITNSHALKKHLESKALRVDEVIWSEVDPKMFYPDVKQANTHTLVTVKDLSKDTGIGVVLEALKSIEDKLIAQYIILGDGPHKDYFKALCEKLSLASTVHFLGNVSHQAVADTLRKADIKIYAAERQESCPHVILEAMMTSVPVIVTPIGDAPRIINESGAGMIIPFHDVPATANAILTLFKNKSMRTKMQANARKFAMEHFSNEIIFSKYERIYRNSLE